jgi:hypothetical protein
VALSPDGRELVWTLIDLRNADLVMVDNFHLDK